jgi:uncharacterized membrane protein YuzA (DUF378 family)
MGQRRERGKSHSLLAGLSLLLVASIGALVPATSSLHMGGAWAHLLGAALMTWVLGAVFTLPRALGLTLMGITGLELVQPLFGRTASVLDLAWGALGAVGAVCALRGLRKTRKR